MYLWRDTLPKGTRRLGEARLHPLHGTNGVLGPVVVGPSIPEDHSGSDIMDAAGDSPVPAKRMPWDVKLIGWLALTGGIAGFVMGSLLAWGVVGYRDADWCALTLFGTVDITSNLRLGIMYMVKGPLSFVKGYGLLKGRAFGWWLYMVTLVEASVNGILLAPIRPCVAAFGLSIICLQIAWLIFRARLYRPLGSIRDLFVGRQNTC